MVYYPEGPSTQHLRTLVPNTIKGMVFGTRILKYCVLGPSGLSISQAAGSELIAKTSKNAAFLSQGVTLRSCQASVAKLVFNVPGNPADNNLHDLCL